VAKNQNVGVIYYGTTAYPLPEAHDMLRQEGISFDTCRIKSFPFSDEVVSFVNSHEVVFIIEQNRDAQMRTLLINEEDFDPSKLVSVLYYAGLSMSANVIQEQISDYYEANKLPRLSEVSN
jgi:2-oxoglutarate ferredoxin oxidoreductase subunit alpha